MKRSELKRRTPLKARTPLRASGRLAKRLPDRSGTHGTPKARERRRRPPSASDIPAASRDAVWERSGGRCEARTTPDCCGTAGEMHHRQLRRTRDHRPVNLLHVCIACHATIGAFPERSYRLGLMIHNWVAPEDIEPFEWRPDVD